MSDQPRLVRFRPRLPYPLHLPHSRQPLGQIVVRLKQVMLK